MTEAGLEHAERAGKALGAALTGPITVLFGGTRRSRETAEAVIAGIGDDSRTAGPIDSFAMRNPDMYVAGTRVNMVSSPAALAEQVPGMTTEQVEANPWWMEFFASHDRIGWWLSQSHPSGENVEQLADRILTFTRSLADPGPLQGRTVVAVTHSPLLRAVLLRGTGSDIGEPPYATGADIRATPDGNAAISRYDPLSP